MKTTTTVRRCLRTSPTPFLKLIRGLNFPINYQRWYALLLTILLGTTTWAQTNNALNFDGAGGVMANQDYVSIAHNSLLNLNGGSYTLEAWVFPTDASNQTIISKGNGAGAANQDIFLFSIIGDRMFFQLGNTTGGSETGTSNTDIPQNQWSHVAVTYNSGTMTATFYLNGVEDGTFVFTQPLYNTDTNPAYIGRQGTVCNCNPFDGSIDEVRVWSDIRTQKEISLNMNNSLTGSEANLVAYYQFNEGVANGNNTALTTVFDKTSNNLDGTLTQMALSGTTSNFVAGFTAVNNALDFDGTDDFVNVSSPFTGFTNAITVEAWINLNTLTSAEGVAGQSTANVDNLATSNVWLLGNVGTTNGSLTFFVNDNGTFRSATSTTDFRGTGWHHVVGVADASGVTLYVDGVVEATSGTGISSGIFSNGSAVMHLGKDSRFASGRFMDGEMDEVRVWNVARTCADILSTKDVELTGSETGLVAYYNFNSGIAGGSNTNVTLFDLDATNSNNGTLTNFGTPPLTGTTSNWIAATNNVSGNTAVAQPEINVQANTNNIVSGETAINATLNTFFPFTAIGGNTEQTFTLQNTGTGTLNISSITSSDANFIISGVSTVIGGNNTTFTVTFAPTASGAHTSTITINSNDCDEAAYTFQVRGTAASGNTNALDFDGTDDRVELPVARNTLTNYTIETWFKFDGNTTDGFAPIIGGASANFFIGKNTGDTQFGIQDGAEYRTTTAIADAWDGNWHHVAVVRNGTAITVFLDGIQRYTDNWGTVGTGAIWVGAENDGGGFYFTGEIDEVRIWDDARTQDEIIANMNQSLAGSEANLVAYYNMNQGVANGNNTTELVILDASLNTNNSTDISTTGFETATAATSLNSGTTSNFVAGYTLINNALSFNGTTDYVLTSLNLPGGDFTMEAWIQYEGAAGDNFQPIIASTNEQFFIGKNNGDANFGIQDGVGSYIGNINSANAFDGNWHHVAVSRSGTTISLFIDGVFVFSGTFSGAAASTLRIGNEPEGGGFFFTGKIDEVRIWNVAKTCAQINATKDIELTGTETDLLAYYNFNHGTAAGNNTGLTTLPDISTNSNTGTLTDFAGLDGSVNSGQTSNWVDGSGNNVSGNTPTNQPEIVVRGNGVVIADGDGTPAVGDNTDFGSLSAGTSKTLTYLIENTGTADLAITSIVVSGVGMADYSLSNVPTSVPAGESATFNVTFAPSSVATDIGATITINNTDCDEGVYDFVVQGDGTQAGPGGVTAGLRLWLKADAGVTGTTTVTQWNDQSGSGLNATGAGTPAFMTNSLNFNPMINFNGTDARFATAATSLFSSNTSPVTFFTVFNTTNNEGQKFLVNQRYNNNGVTNIQLGYDTGLGSGSGNFGLHIGSSRATIAAANTIANNTYYLMSTLILNSGTSPNNINIFQNGNSLALSDDNSGFTNAGSYETTDPNVPIDIGVRNDAFGGSTFNGFHAGNIGEVIIYTNTPSATERQQIESYLAVKYGITKTGDYLSSNGTTIWNATTAAGFLNDIAGIGRDDASALSQKQSKSINTGAFVTIALNTLATDNANNTNTFASDRTFMIWGNNAGSLDYDTDKIQTNLPNSGVDGYLARIWQVQNGGVGATQVNVDISSLTITGVADAGDLVLLISNSATDFSAATAVFADSLVSNVATFNNVGFATGTQYFSIGRWNGTTSISPDRGNYLDVSGSALQNAVLTGGVALSGLNDNFSVEMWVKMTSASSSGFIFYNGSSGINGYGLFYDGAGHIQPVIGATTVTNTTTTIAENTWTHVALVRDGGTLRLYINGKEEALGSNPAVTAPTTSTRIGTRTTATFGFTGVVDELRLWSAVRSQQQIRENMHLVLTGTESGLANYYQFNETSGNALDAVGGNDALLQNSATFTVSDCPVGKGRSFTQASVTAAGSYAFTGTGVDIQFAAGVLPQGEVVVTQIDGVNSPTNIPTSVNTYPGAYWIVRNYGANTTFTELTQIQFTIPNNDLISALDEGNPVDLRLFKRPSNSGSGDAWTMIGAASAANASTKQITFTTFDPDFTSFSQVLPATVNAGTSSLPVTLGAFEATRQDEKTVLVRWQTLSEFKNAGFEVQRSENGVDFEILGFVDGAGDSKVKLNYRFVDNQATRSAYYRLKQIDFDGEFKYSPVVFVQGSDLQKISIYPNPFTRELKLDFGSTQPTKLPVYVEVFTAQGKRLLRTRGNATQVQGMLNQQVGELANGVYIIRLIIGNKVHIKRVVKE
ncbi:MAG TPA: hypothetical protein DCS93_28425 [Microscillaceae bacterium]|nr:hypothetical protein [Microscillaceae bacterium]